MLDRERLGEELRLVEPGRGRGEGRAPGEGPRPRRRDVDEVVPEADPPPRLVEVDPEPRRLGVDVIAQDRVRARLRREGERGRSEPAHDDLVDRAASTPAQRVMHRPQGGQEPGVVGCADRVQRDPHQRRLDDRSIRERAIEVVRGEPGEARPQGEVRGRGFLRLEPGERFDRPDDTQ